MLQIRRSQKSSIEEALKKSDDAIPVPPPKRAITAQSNATAITSGSSRRLAIRKEQIETFRTESVETFHETTVGFIKRQRPGWSSGKTDPEIKLFVGALTEVARQHLVFTVGAVQTFILLKIDHDFPLPLSEFRAGILRKKSLDEHYRMEQFHLSITTTRNLIPITLSSKPDALGDAVKTGKLTSRGGYT